MEEVQGERALAFAKSENAKTEAAASDPMAADVREDPERPRVQGEDSERLQDRRALLQFLDERRELPRFTKALAASLDEFRKKEPAWEVVLDVDKLGKDEGESWVYKGATCAASTTRIINPSRAP